MFMRMIVTYFRPWVNGRVYTVRRGLAKGLKRRGGLGFLPLSRLTKEETFLKQLKLDGQTVYDIGGWEGVFTLFFARLVGETGRVLTFEPYPENYNRIIENIRLNGFHNVEVKPLALGEARDTTTLVLERSLSGTGTIREETKTQRAQKHNVQVIQVEVDSLDNLIEKEKLPKPDFVKIDVEGMELAVLKGMTETIGKFKPRLFIEVHQVGSDNGASNARETIALLLAKGYSILDVESARNIATEQDQVIAGGHIVCTET